ncbi:MAG: cobalamin biosynthesis protein [Alphaproteobacteria bacterium]|nr:cobalamin biosynthesis protein [Alphaproteobacteria bacterium]MCA0451989.1 cobalamin biosynthesis protein [Pseudomonadota bacterium]
MIVTIGIGCKRGASSNEVLELVRATLAKARVAPGSVGCIATLDRKEGEAAIDTVATALGVPVRFFSATELAAETRIAHPSESVAEAIDTPSVAEAAALLAAGSGAKLIVPKRKSARATCAIAATGDTP